MTYTVIDLHPPGFVYSRANAVNDAGQVLISNFSPPALWDGGKFSFLESGGHSLTVNGLSAGGELAGVLDGVGVRGRPGGFLRLNTFIPRLGGTGAIARAISPGGFVVGSAPKEFPLGGITLTKQRPARWNWRQPQDLSTLGGDTSRGEALAVNASGQIVGWSETGNIIQGSGEWHATLWSGGSPRDLHAPSPPGFPMNNSQANAINELGVVVGDWHGLTATMILPFVWTEGEGMRGLPRTYPNGTGYSRGVALGINNHNQIVGAMDGNAILWDNGQLINLQTTIPSTNGWVLQEAWAINDEGWIVGSARGANGGPRAVLLRPDGCTNCFSRGLEVEVLQPTKFLNGFDITKDKVQLATGGSPAVAVAADGTSRLLLRFTSPVQGTFKLSLRASDGAAGVTGQTNFDGALSSPGGTEREQMLKLTLQAIDGEPQAFAVYHAPEDFTRPGTQDETAVVRTIQLEAIIDPEECVGARRPVPILVVRPPVVVLHGMWSDRSNAFKGFEAELKKRLPEIEIFGPDKYRNAAHFEENYLALLAEVLTRRKELAARQIEAHRVDVFGHSMGGVLSRIWAGAPASDYRRFDNYGAGDIHKLVTIDSVHYGGFPAENLEVWKTEFECRISYTVLALIMEAIEMPIDQGAVDDFLPYGPAIIRLNATPMTTPSHAIAGHLPAVKYAEDILDTLPLVKFLLSRILPGGGTLICDDAFAVPIPYPNDMLVTIPSQLGGLEGNATNIFEHAHMGAAGAAAVIQRSLELLNTPTSNDAFAPGFPTRSPPWPDHVRLLVSKASLGAKAPLGFAGQEAQPLEILEPQPGVLVLPGQQIALTVRAPADANLQGLIVAAPQFIYSRTNAPYTIQVTVPTNVAGPFRITALAVDSLGRLLTNTVAVQVQPASALDTLEVVPPVHYFILPGTTLQLAVHGVYRDGVRRNLTASGSGTTYVSLDAAVVTVTPDGLVMPQGPGETTVTASHGVNANVRVIVDLLPRANLGLQLEQAPGEAWAGVPASVTLSLTNAGPAAAASVVLRVALPAGAQIVGSPAAAVCQSRQGEHFCVFESLAAGASVRAQFAVMFPAPGDYQTRWSVNARSFDPQPDDNNADVPFHVRPLDRPEVALDRPEALEQPALDWRTGTNSPWFGQTKVSHDGVDAAQSGVIGHSQQSWLEVTNILASDGIVSFWWKVSSEGGYDFLRFYFNGVEQPGRISGGVDWQPKSFELPPGTNVLRWAYSKDGSGTGGADSGWVDEVQFLVYADPLADTDNDGLPDLWEVRSFGSFGQTGADDDDKDGISNADEYLDGTDPTDSTSFFPRLTVNLIGQGTVQRSPDLPKYTNGQMVALTAVPDLAQSFLGWSGSLSGAANPRTLVMNGSKTVTAAFTNFVFLGEAVEQPTLTWLSDGDAFWFKQTNVTHDGVDAAQSGRIGDNGETWMEARLTGPGVLSFWWKVSSETGRDYLRFLLDGTELSGSISGDASWQFRAVNVEFGSHLVRWAYSKNAGSSRWLDAGWVDDVQFLADTDGDGLPDVWEARSFGSLAQTGVGDYDHDGISNMEEYLDGTDPTSNTSFFPRLTVKVIGLGRVVQSPNRPRYIKGQAVTLTAIPDVGHSFLGWSGGLSGTAEEVTLVMNGSQTVTAAFTSFVALGEALDQPMLNWVSGGPYVFWFKQTNVTHDGVDAAQSGLITDYRDSWMEVSLTGPGVLSFWWKVSSEANYDYLRFLLDGARLDSISGEVGWQFRTVNVGFGSHLAHWRYSKDAAVSMGQDAGWVDEVNWAPFRITAGSLQTNGTFRMTLTGVSASTCVIQVSSNLTTWTTLETISITQPVTTFVDSAATNSTQRFYRALLP